MIIGHGVDIVEIARVENILNRFPDRFMSRVFTEEEKKYCRNQVVPAESFSARLAAKEAVYKALSPEIDILYWQEIEVVCFPEQIGIPKLKLRGETENLEKRLGIKNWHLSLSHEREYAAASVIAEGGD
ncbi:holo-ACP synthase [Halarsenatibacter silvermanii]|uniref:Holo-[acyl-carrier-protein] synthase n=1 Tax=Halarsenatibacter silvermanii TaxID=321763 RepID=A0A1G9NEY8_9FIRM|nr:holo-ACP synthase [Halarsenatibacter silvermanii]SDL84607.1 holo-[acyl-carrier-protein] synthase [Halarsenatibacter silvermanii]